MVLAMYACMARRRGIPLDALGGTIQTDILKEFIAQKEWIFPPEPSVRLVVDMIEWCCDEMPRWHPVSISGYHIREAGATAAQELAFTLADGFAYVAACIERGLPSTASRRACRSSSTPTSTSSRRSPSTGPRGASGRARCASASARARSARC